MMGYEGRDLLLTGVAGQRSGFAAQACVCRLWAVAWLTGGSGSVATAH